MIEKYDRAQKDKSTNPFIDPAGYRAYASQKEQAFKDQLAAQRQTIAAPPTH